MVLQFVGEYVAAFLSETELSLWLGFFLLFDFFFYCLIYLPNASQPQRKLIMEYPTQVNG